MGTLQYLLVFFNSSF